MDIDKKIHEIYNAHLLYRPLPNGVTVRCGFCGTPLRTYYAENKLYLVKCGGCDMITMVWSDSPIHAAEMVGEDVE